MCDLCAKPVVTDRQPLLIIATDVNGLGHVADIVSILGVVSKPLSRGGNPQVTRRKNSVTVVDFVADTQLNYWYIILTAISTTMTCAICALYV